MNCDDRELLKLDNSMISIYDYVSVIATEPEETIRYCIPFRIPSDIQTSRSTLSIFPLAPSPCQRTKDAF